MYYQPTPIDYADHHFLIMSAPDSSSMKKCSQDMKAHNVKLLVRCCDNTYNESELTSKGITVKELIFPDGQLPSKADIKKWSQIVDEFFKEQQQQELAASQATPTEESKDDTNTASKSGSSKNKPKPARIGVHCVAGLGRAPLLVALALVNRGCEPFQAIDLIRKNRKGALNIIQANFIVEYKPASEGSGRCGIF